MSVVPSSQFELSRLRRDLSKAVSCGDWAAVAVLDDQLDKALEGATNDKQCDALKVLNEMHRLLTLYKEIMDACEVKKA
mgnify:CR=1 FL=1